MEMKNLLIIFIVSFLCVIYSINHLSFKYIDHRIDRYVIEQKFDTYDTNVINQALSQQNVRLADENTRLLMILTVSFAVLVLMLAVQSWVKYLFLIFFMLAYFAAYKLLFDHYIFVSLAGPLGAMIFTPFFAGTYRRIFLERKNNKIEKILGKYISKDIKNKILKNDTNAELGGKKAEISIMFADIRGFTSLSETHSAEEVSSLLNEYFSLIEPVINKYNGVINKFIGDAVLVIFGEPIQDKNHARNAVLCAYELNKKVKSIQEKWISEGKPKIDIGIGVNTGEAFVGNVGTADRFEYTVIGDAVNIASRIEDYNKIYKTHILISQFTYAKISHIVDVIKIREVSIKGKAKKINIYEVLRVTEQ